jgi:hypothetical protein
MAFIQDILCLVPVTVFHRTLQICSMVAVQVGEDPILIPQTSIHPLGRIGHGSKATVVLLGGLWSACRGEASCGDGRRENAVGDGIQGLLGGGMSCNHRDDGVRCIRRAIDLAGSLFVVGWWR